MLIISLFVLSLATGIIVLMVHNDDEIHQLLAFLSSAIALICVYALIPPLVKICLGLLFFTIGYLNNFYSFFKCFKFYLTAFEFYGKFSDNFFTE